MDGRMDRSALGCKLRPRLAHAHGLLLRSRGPGGNAKAGFRQKGTPGREQSEPVELEVGMWGEELLAELHVDGLRTLAATVRLGLERHPCALVRRRNP